MNRFVSKGSVQGEVELEDETNNGNSNEAIIVHAAPTDNRTLYERLQSNKLKKEEEFAEKTRLANLIKKLDPDEIEFLAEQEQIKKQQMRTGGDTQQELVEFRRLAREQQQQQHEAIESETAGVVAQAKSMVSGFGMVHKNKRKEREKNTGNEKDQGKVRDQGKARDQGKERDQGKAKDQGKERDQVMEQTKRLRVEPVGVSESVKSVNTKGSLLGIMADYSSDSSD